MTFADTQTPVLRREVAFGFEERSSAAQARGDKAPPMWGCVSGILTPSSGDVRLSECPR
jgi:hypothetical protein